LSSTDPIWALEELLDAVDHGTLDYPPEDTDYDAFFAREHPERYWSKE
jgi:hypothetical protein